MTFITRMTNDPFVDPLRDARRRAIPLWARVIASPAFIFFGGFFMSVVVAAQLVFNQATLFWATAVSEASIVGSALAFSAAVFMILRLSKFAGVTSIRYILPTMLASYGLLALVLLFAQPEFDRNHVILSFLIALIWCHAAFFVKSKTGTLHFAVVPSSRSEALSKIEGPRWTTLHNPEIDSIDCDAIVADLHVDLGEAWEKFLARAAVKGVSVYHVTQVSEALTGRVQIQHPSEDVIESLSPDRFYPNLKRAIDLVGAILLLPIFLPVMAAIALLIKMDSKGPALFKQERVGFRGETFTIFKFRSMHTDMPRGNSFTAEDDPRITRVGRYIRKRRLDELPQIFNILRGDMSWIGPRPEAVQLAEWYAKSIPFFEYRYIVRPGISGWAQVQQGYAAEIDDTSEKLHYDFYYIKHLSFTLDLVIVAKTIKTIVGGFGAR